MKTEVPWPSRLAPGCFVVLSISRALQAAFKSLVLFPFLWKQSTQGTSSVIFNRTVVNLLPHPTGRVECNTSLFLCRNPYSLRVFRWQSVTHEDIIEVEFLQFTRRNQLVPVEPKLMVNWCLCVP